MNMTEEQSFGALLRGHRRIRGLTQEELAERAEVSVRQLAYLERDKHAPRPSTIRRLGEALGLSEDEHATLLAATGVDMPQGQVESTHTTSLPLQPTSFIGRQREVDEVHALLQREDVRLLTLTGPGGVGKTRLAVRAAETALTTFPHGAVFVSLASLADPRLVASTIGIALRITEESGQPSQDAVTNHLRSKHLLLLLDNFEHVLPGADVVSHLLTSCRQLKILVTSRAILRLAAEHEYPVPPLSFPTAEHLPGLDALCQYDAIRLFVQRAEAVKPGFRITDENASAIAKICYRLDGLPLAIELAAARIRLFPPNALLAHLPDRFQLLTDGPWDAPARQQTLRTTIDWSFSLLSAEEQTLFARLSVFAGGCTFEAAEAVCNAEDRVRMVATLTSLVEQSLVQEKGDQESRFLMLETIRQYAVEHLDTRGERQPVERRHAEYFLQVAEEAEKEHGERYRTEWLPRLQSECDNLRVALSWSLKQEGTEALALRLAGALARFWFEQFAPSEGRRWLEHALAISRSSQAAATYPRAHAQALTGAAQLAQCQADYAVARDYAEQSVTLWRSLGDALGLARALLTLGRVAMQQADHALAAAVLAEAAELYRELGAVHETVWALGAIGNVEIRQGRLTMAQPRLEAALALSQQAGITEQVLHLHCALAELAWVRGETDVARRHHEQAMTTLSSLQDPTERSGALGHLAWDACQFADYEQAAALHAERLSLARAQTGSPDRETRIAWALNHLGDVARCQGNDTRAAALYEESIALFRQQEERQGTAAVLHNLGHLALAGGDPGRARDLFGESAALFQDLNFVQSIADCIAGMACVAAQQGQSDRAALLFGAADSAHAALDASGKFIECANRLAWERDAAIARGQLSNGAWEEAWSAGRAMALEQAIECALTETETNLSGE